MIRNTAYGALVGVVLGLAAGAVIVLADRVRAEARWARVMA